MSKGSKRERELARKLDKANYHVIRSPASGSVDRDQPDLAFAHKSQKVVLEMKYTGKDTAYFGEEEVAALRRFGAAFDANAALCVRWKGDTEFYVCAPEEARRTPEGNYAIDREMELETVL